MVDFGACEIKHHEYEKEIIINKDTRYQDREIVRFSESKISYTHFLEGVSKKYESPILYIELINLRMKLYQKKRNIYLYQGRCTAYNR